MSDMSVDTGNAPRQGWIAILVRAPRELLRERVEAALAAADAQPAAFEWLRLPETGLTMVRARVGNTGDRFNLGETTVTRSVVRHRCAAGHVAVGVGYVQGRDAERSRWIAMLDALLQQPEHHATIARSVVEPLRAAIERERRAAEIRTAASRVRFFTLQAEAT